jgi:hypothetical protein
VRCRALSKRGPKKETTKPASRVTGYYYDYNTARMTGLSATGFINWEPIENYINGEKNSIRKSTRPSGIDKG